MHTISRQDGDAQGKPIRELARALDALSVGALVIDADDTVLACNDAAVRVLELHGHSPVGRPLRTLDICREIPRLREEVASVRRTGAIARIEHAERERAGERRPLWLTVIPLDVGSSGRGQVVVTIDDRAELAAARDERDMLRAQLRAARAQLEAQAETHRDALADVNQELSAANESLRIYNEELNLANQELHERLVQLEASSDVDERKDQFLAMLAHELRNQLAAIDQALEIVRLRVQTDPAVAQATRVAGRQVALQTRLVDDLLDVSRIIRGQFELRREIVDLRAVVNAAADAVRAAAAARVQQLDVVVPPDALPVDADPARLRQAIQNLLGNAAKFTPPGGSIRVVATREQDSAVVRVTDTGRGIEPPLLSRVFDLYFQAPSARTDAQGGLGIGLTLVRRLVELQGGSVVARSEGRGRGSQFEILLPLAARALPDPPPVAGPRATPAVSRRILVVEDNRDSRETLRIVLELQGHKVVEAADGETGVRLAVTETPDVVLIDIGLPDIDGYEVAARIRRRLGTGIRLIAQSGFGDADARQRAERAGFDAHLVKPVEVRRLSALLASA